MNRLIDINKAEDLIDVVQHELQQSEISYKLIARRIGLSESTLYALASGRTKWPRPVTLFTVLEFFGYQLMVTKKL